MQAQSYVKAIDYSIVAAQIGFNIAEEAINFFKVVESRTSEADLTSYLAGMWNMALNGHHNAQLALDEFKGVRTTIETVCIFFFFFFWFLSQFILTTHFSASERRKRSKSWLDLTRLASILVNFPRKFLASVLYWYQI